MTTMTQNYNAVATVATVAVVGVSITFTTNNTESVNAMKKTARFIHVANVMVN